MTTTANTNSLTCPICLETVFPPGNPAVRVVHANEDRAISQINHVYHRICIEEWRRENNTCPECRQTIVDLNATLPDPPAPNPHPDPPALNPHPDSPAPNLHRPFWTHRKVLSTILLTTAATLTLTSAAFRAHTMNTANKNSLQDIALELAVSSIVNHPGKCGAAMAALSMTPEITKALKFCLWDSPCMRAALLSGAITAGIIRKIAPR